MNDVDRDRIRQRVVNDLKQSCLDLTGAAGELFDRFDAHGLDAAWEGDGVLVVVRMSKAYEELRSFLEQQAVRRLTALGVSLDRPSKDRA